MKKQVVLGINIVIALALVVASALLANQWRLDGSNYSAKRQADGEIERNTLVANAKSEAGIILARYVSAGEKEKGAKLAAALASGKGIEAQADTARVKMNNASTEANAEAIKAFSERAKTKSKGLLDKY